jgi:Lar family restriction alleviation protein
MTEEELLPCPFCGGKAKFERIGTPRQSCIVVCEDCGCSLETGEQGFSCGMNWNQRMDMKK